MLQFSSFVFAQTFFLSGVLHVILGPSTWQARKPCLLGLTGSSPAGGHSQGAEETHPGAPFRLQWCCNSEFPRQLWAGTMSSCWQLCRQLETGTCVWGMEARQVVAFIFSTPGRAHYWLAQYDRPNSGFLFRREKKIQWGKEASARAIENCKGLLLPNSSKCYYNYWADHGGALRFPKPLIIFMLGPPNYVRGVSFVLGNLLEWAVYCSLRLGCSFTRRHSKFK